MSSTGLTVEGITPPANMPRCYDVLEPSIASFENFYHLDTTLKILPNRAAPSGPSAAACVSTKRSRMTHNPSVNFILFYVYFLPWFIGGAADDYSGMISRLAIQPGLRSQLMMVVRVASRRIGPDVLSRAALQSQRAAVSPSNLQLTLYRWIIGGMGSPTEWGRHMH